MFSGFNWFETTLQSPTMLALIAFSIVTFGVAIERLHYYSKRRGNADEVALKIVEHVRAGHVDQAQRACQHTNHPVGPVAEQLFGEGDADPESVAERLYVALSQQKLVLEKNLNILGTMATVAPLVGLLGTVWGIMRAFHDMAQVGSAAPSVVAAGVAEALITTAAGLVIAVPAYMFYNYFTRRMNVMLTVAENTARRIRTVMTETPAEQHRHAGTGRPAGTTAARRGAPTVESAEPAPVR